MMLDIPVVTIDQLGDKKKYYQPSASLKDRNGKERTLPTKFYRVNSWDEALKLKLTPDFSLCEFLLTDLHEPSEVTTFPRYIPCAVSVLATHLQVVRDKLGTYVHISANGGYRSPVHHLTSYASPHAWGTAANIYRIGDELLDNEEVIAKYSEIVHKAIPHANVRRYGNAQDETDDHLHIDLGYLLFEPEDAEVKK